MPSPLYISSFVTYTCKKKKYNYPINYNAI